MKEQSCVLPVKCKRCDGVFDLWYDLENNRKQEIFDINEAFSRTFKENFCWTCRQTILHNLENKLPKEYAISFEED